MADFVKKVLLWALAAIFVILALVILDFPSVPTAGTSHSATTPTTTVSAGEETTETAQDTAATEAPTETTTEETTEATAEPTAEPATEASTEPTAEPTTEPTDQPTEDNGRDYVLNTNTKKFHYPQCSSAKSIKDKNKAAFHGTREELIAMGYDPCGKCHP